MSVQVLVEGFYLLTATLKPPMRTVEKSRPLRGSEGWIHQLLRAEDQGFAGVVEVCSRRTREIRSSQVLSFCCFLFAFFYFCSFLWG